MANSHSAKDNFLQRDEFIYYLYITKKKEKHNAFIYRIFVAIFLSNLYMSLQIELQPDVVFYHIEKCAGTSIEKALYDYFLHIYRDDQIYIPEKNDCLHYNITQKSFFEENKFKVILCHISFNDPISVFSDHLSIVCIRNPVERILSHYYYFDFNEYNKCLHSFSRDELIQYVKTRKIVLYRVSGETNKLEVAFEHLKKINGILIFEKLEEDMVKLNRVLNHHFKVNFELKIDKLNSTLCYPENFQKDRNALQELDELCDEWQLYNRVCEMEDDERFKYFD